MWDFGSGQLHKFYHHSPKDSDIKDSTITGIVYLHWEGKQCLFVSSWGHTIRVFEVNTHDILFLSIEFLLLVASFTSETRVRLLYTQWRNGRVSGCPVTGGGPNFRAPRQK